MVRTRKSEPVASPPPAEPAVPPVQESFPELASPPATETPPPAVSPPAESEKPADQPAPPSDQPAADSPIDASAVARAAEAAAEADKAKKAEASKLLERCVAAFQKGESAYTAGMLESGRLAHSYILKRLALKDTRAAAVQALEGALSAHASDAVDVSRLIRAAFAADLLTAGVVASGADASPYVNKRGETTVPNVAYSHFRDHYCRLVESTGSGTNETFRLLPGVESEAIACFKHCVDNGLKRDAIGALIVPIVRTAANLASQRTQAESEARRQESAEREAAAKAQQAARAAAEKAAEEAKKLADAETDAARRAALTAAAEASKAALLEEQRKTIAANEAAALAAKNAAEAKKAADKAAAVNARVNAAPRVPGEARTPSAPPAADARQGENLLSVASKASPKDLGVMVAGMLAKSTDPQAAIHAALHALSNSPDLSNGQKRKLQGMILAWDRPDARPEPAVASAALVNGN